MLGSGTVSTDRGGMLGAVSGPGGRPDQLTHPMNDPGKSSAAGHSLAPEEGTGASLVSSSMPCRPGIQVRLDRAPGLCEAWSTQPLTVSSRPRRAPSPSHRRLRLRGFNDWPKGTQQVVGRDLYPGHVAPELATLIFRVNESHDADGHLGARTLQL